MLGRSQLANRKAQRFLAVLADTSPTPTLSACVPSEATPLGGTAITMTGTGFLSYAGLSYVESVSFGDVVAASFTVLSATSLTAVTPAHPSGAVTVVIETSGGCAMLAEGVTFFGPVRAALAGSASVNAVPALGARLAGVASLTGTLRTPNPTVTAVTPNTGVDLGGDAITDLHGTGFVNGCTVAFGEASATSVVFVSATRLTCVTPAGTEGATNVTVTNPDTQTSGATGNGLFTYTKAILTEGGASLLTEGGAELQPES